MINISQGNPVKLFEIRNVSTNQKLFETQPFHTKDIFENESSVRIKLSEFQKKFEYKQVIQAKLITV